MSGVEFPILSILSSCPNVRVFRVFRLPVSPSAPQAPRPVPRAFFLPQAGVQPISQKKMHFYALYLLTNGKL